MRRIGTTVAPQFSLVRKMMVRSAKAKGGLVSDPLALPPRRSRHHQSIYSEQGPIGHPIVLPSLLPRDEPWKIFLLEQISSRTLVLGGPWTPSVRWIFSKASISFEDRFATSLLRTYGHLKPALTKVSPWPLMRRGFDSHWYGTLTSGWEPSLQNSQWWSPRFPISYSMDDGDP